VTHPANGKPGELKRRLGVIDAGALVTGTVIGTGIFLVPSTMAREMGSVGGVFLVWVIGGLLSLAGALSYAELGAAFPEAGGEYVFLRRAYGPLWGFLFGWQQVVIGKTGGIASLATALALFLGFFVHGVREDWIRLSVGHAVWTLTGIQSIALASILALTAVNYLGIAVGGAVQTALTMLKVAAILGLVFLAFGAGEGRWAHFLADPEGVQGASDRWIGFGAALAAALWAYDGWNNLTMVGAEIHNPHTTIPKVLILGMLGVMLLYGLTNVAYFYVLPLNEVVRTERVAQDVAMSAVGLWGGTAVTLAAAVSTLGSLNGAILTGARVSYAMARDGLFFRHMADLNPVHHSPAKALLLQCAFACGLILILGHHEHAFERLFDYAIFGTWLFYGITALSVIVLRRRLPDLPRPYRTLGYPWVPLIFFLLAGAFCLSMILRRPQETGLGLAFLAAGLPFYGYWRFFGQTINPSSKA
jgi:APA family basic amino acid/polyamine antiporter